MRRLLVYRSELLPLSETFILEQAAKVRRYEAVLVGSKRLHTSLSLETFFVLAQPQWMRLLAARLKLATTLWVRHLASRLRRSNVALIHAHFAIDGAEALSLASRLCVPLIVTLHGYDVMLRDEVHGKTKRGQRYLEARNRLWEQAALFLCVSSAIRDAALRGGFPAAKLRVQYTGIDTDALVFQAELTRQPVVLFVGRLVEKKGCRILLEAMGRLRKRVPGARLCLIGDGPERFSLQLLAAELAPETLFLGALPSEEVRAHMREFRCVAAPSITAGDGDAEGLPTVLLEAMAIGVPVVSTWSSGIPELVVHGKNGLLSEEKDAHALAENLLRVCTDDAVADRLRRAGRERVEQEFSAQEKTRMLECIYDEVVGDEAGD